MHFVLVNGLVTIGGFDGAEERDGVLPYDASRLYVVSNKNDSYKKG